MLESITVARDLTALAHYRKPNKAGKSAHLPSLFDPIQIQTKQKILRNPMKRVVAAQRFLRMQLYHRVPPPRLLLAHLQQPAEMPRIS